MIQRLYLKITNRCNLQCPFCYHHQSPNDMTLKIANTVLKQYNPKEVVFHGGEPLLNSKLALDIINNNPQYQYSITSNLAMKLTKQQKSLLSSIDSIATSYSSDRFSNHETYQQWLENVIGLANKNITMLVTLSKAQLQMPPEKLIEIFKQTKAAYLYLERLFDLRQNQDFYIATDQYILKTLQLLPTKANVLYNSIKESIAYGVPLYPIDCDKNILTVSANGAIQHCPNMIDYPSKRPKECLICELYKYCQTDCYSFRGVCRFPKKSFQFLLKKERE